MAEGMAGVLPGLARRQGLSDMLHRTAARVPGKLAVASGAARLTFAELEAAVVSDRGCAGGRRPEQGRPAGTAVPQLLAVRRPVFATARLGVILVPVNFMLGPGRSLTSLATVKRQRSSPKMRWPPLPTRRWREPGSTSLSAR